MGTKLGKKKTDLKKGGGPSEHDPLKEAITTFDRGDYARAKIMLAQKAADPTLADGQREQARELYKATFIERGTLWVGIACVGLLVLVISVTALTQQ